MKIKNILRTLAVPSCILATIPLVASCSRNQPIEKDYFEWWIDSGVYEPKTQPREAWTYDSVDTGTKAYLENINNNKNIFYDDLFLWGRQCFFEYTTPIDDIWINYLKIQLNSVDVDEGRISYEIAINCKRVPAQNNLMYMHIKFSDFLFRVESYGEGAEQKTRAGLSCFYDGVSWTDFLVNDDKWSLEYEIDYYRPFSYHNYSEAQMNAQKIIESDEPSHWWSLIECDILENLGASWYLTYDSEYFSKVTVKDGE